MTARKHSAAFADACRFATESAWLEDNPGLAIGELYYAKLSDAELDEATALALKRIEQEFAPAGGGTA